jgi:hypothetical protein
MIDRTKEYIQGIINLIDNEKYHVTDMSDYYEYNDKTKAIPSDPDEINISITLRKVK